MKVSVNWLGLAAVWLSDEHEPTFRNQACMVSDFDPEGHVELLEDCQARDGFIAIFQPETQMWAYVPAEFVSIGV